jgi:hypothetical protein
MTYFYVLVQPLGHILLIYTPARNQPNLSPVIHIDTAKTSIKPTTVRKVTM